MGELITAIGLVLVIEGVAYALFPDAMRRMMAEVLNLPAAALRAAGLVAAVAGVAIVWLIRG